MFAMKVVMTGVGALDMLETECHERSGRKGREVGVGGKGGKWWRRKLW